MSKIILWVFLAIAIGAVLVIVGWYVLTSIGGSLWLPKNQVVGESEDICLLFFHEPGAGEWIKAITIHCDDLSKNPESYGRSYESFAEKDKVIDSVTPMECPSIRIKNNTELYFKINKICSSFAAKNPIQKEELVEISYKVEKSGKFIEIDKKVKSL